MINIFEQLYKLCKKGPADLPLLPQSFKDWMLAQRLPCLYGLLSRFDLALFTRKRDIYYALIGLASDINTKDHPELYPDYVSPIEAIITRFGRFFWKQGYGSDMLLRTGLAKGITRGVPSWIQDFTLTHEGDITHLQ